MATLNRSALYIKFERQVGKRLKKELDAIIETAVEQAKEELIQEILNDPISQEIAAGAEARPTSGVVSRGNLFSFIGFKSDRKPIDELIELIEETVRSRPSQLARRRGSFFNYFKMVSYPRIKNIESSEKTSYDVWSSGSWVNGVRNGIAGFSNYIYNAVKELEGSRSGTGLQNENRNLGGSHDPKPEYLERQISNFERKLAQIDIDKLEIVL